MPAFAMPSLTRIGDCDLVSARRRCSVSGLQTARYAAFAASTCLPIASLIRHVQFENQMI
jgi:hypothetical protein